VHTPARQDGVQGLQQGVHTWGVAPPCRHRRRRCRRAGHRVVGVCSQHLQACGGRQWGGVPGQWGEGCMQRSAGWVWVEGMESATVGEGQGARWVLRQFPPVTLGERADHVQAEPLAKPGLHPCDKGAEGAPPYWPLLADWAGSGPGPLQPPAYRVRRGS